MTILRYLDFYFIQKPKIGEFFLFLFLFFLLGSFAWIATIHRLAFVRYTALQAESTFLVMKYQAENSLLLRFVPCFQLNSKSAQTTRYQGQIFFFLPPLYKALYVCFWDSFQPSMFSLVLTSLRFFLHTHIFSFKHKKRSGNVNENNCSHYRFHIAGWC